MCDGLEGTKDPSNEATQPLHMLQNKTTVLADPSRAHSTLMPALDYVNFFLRGGCAVAEGTKDPSIEATQGWHTLRKQKHLFWRIVRRHVVIRSKK